MNIHVRGIDRALWKAVQLKATAEDITVGDVLNHVLRGAFRHEDWYHDVADPAKSPNVEGQ